MTSPTDIERAWEQVRRNPRDLEPRRHLAAVLVMHGDPLGEFLTFLLLPEKEGRAGMHQRADELFKRHGDEWFPLPPGEKPSFKRSWSMFIGRGVPDTLGVSRGGPPATDLIEWWAARYPIRRVYAGHTDPTEALAELERRGLFALVESLEFNECTLSGAVDVIANATAGPSSLQLTKPVGLDAARFESLLRGRGLAGVTSLGLATVTLEAPAIRGLWGGLPMLESLRLYNVALGKEILAVPPGVRRRWTDVSIEGSHTGSQVLELVRGLDLSVTRSLRICGASVDDGLLPHLRDAVRAGELQALCRLELPRTYIHAKDLAVLLEAPPPNLEHLDVSNNSIDKEGLEALAAYARQSKTLKSLPLGGIHIGSGVFEESSDWDGTVTGSYERSLSVKDLREKFSFPVALKS